MKPDTFTLDPAVDVIAGSNGMLRFVAPNGEFSIADPFGLVQRVTDQCRTGATDETIGACCNSPAERTAVQELIGALTKRRVLITSNAANPRDLFTDWIRHKAGAPNTELPPILLAGRGVLADALHRKLAAAGFSILIADDESACVIAACDTPDMNWLRHQNQKWLQRHQPFLPAWLDRAQLCWGPLVLPRATGCLECFWHRCEANARRKTCVEHDGSNNVSASTILADLAASLMCAELLRFVFNDYCRTDAGMAWSFDMLNFDFSGTKVMRIPRCAVCGFDA